LTRTIAKAASDQVAYLKESSATARRHAAAALEALSRRLRVPLSELAGKPIAHHRLIDYAQLVPDDISALEGLAQQVGEEASRFAGKAAYSLRRIERIIQQARPVPKIQGWSPSEAQAADWAEATDAAPRMLAELERVCHAFVAT